MVLVTREKAPRFRNCISNGDFASQPRAHIRQGNEGWRVVRNVQPLHLSHVGNRSRSLKNTNTISPKSLWILTKDIEDAE